MSDLGDVTDCCYRHHRTLQKLETEVSDPSFTGGDGESMLLVESMQTPGFSSCCLRTLVGLEVDTVQF
jgi:hypothetical protein